MKYLVLASTFLAGLAGCECGLKRRLVECCDLPAQCPPGEGARPRRCPPPQADVHSPEEVVVRAPRQKIVVEMPPPVTCPAPAAPAVCPAPAPAPAPVAPAAPAMAPGMMAM